MRRPQLAFSTIITAVFLLTIHVVNAQTQSENYLKTTTYQVETSNGTINSQTNNPLTADDKIIQIGYHDGLGRPVQSISVRQSPDKKDVLNFIEYDAYGRQTKEFLPYATTQNTGNFKIDPLTEQEAYYIANYADDINLNAPNPFNEKLLETSPMRRVLKQAAPGESWQMGGGHEIGMAYETNVSLDIVKSYDVSFVGGDTEMPSLVDSGTYSSGDLYKTITFDENYTTGKDHSTEEYKDKMDRIVLKRTFNNEVAHDTYYIYDDFGNLTYVLPPLVDTSAAVDQTILDDLCYQYRYDHRNRLVEKKIPGKGWEYIVYNRLDQPVLTQDANMRGHDEWLFTKYDDFKRVAYTGIMFSNSTRSAMQMAVDDFNANPKINESKSSSPTTIAGVAIYYSNNAFPTTGIVDMHTVNYYDTYIDHGPLSLPNGSIFSQTIEDDVTSLPTVSRVKVLGTNLWITNVTLYDDKGSTIYTASYNALHQTTDTQEIELDFMGRVLQSKSVHSKPKEPPITINEYFTYDHQGRLLTHSHKVNNNAIELLTSNAYDDLGQLERKDVGNTASNPLQQVDYDYNIRGWLKDINNIDNIGCDLFSFRIHYDKPNHGEATDLFNGNISQVNWKTANTNSSIFWYIYQYDDLNRITKGRFAGGGIWNRYTLRDVDYDKNGNLTNLTRHGWQNSSSYDNMDKLVYTYDGNKLMRVTDNGHGTYGFNDGNTIGDDYEYDVNGNMTRDKNKAISTIEYNHLNLPSKIYVDNGTVHPDEITYLYSADGMKQQKAIDDNGNISTTDYAGNYIYKDDKLQFFNHAEGYVEPFGTGFEYVYQYKDHLGSVRLSYSDLDLNGVIDPSTEILQERNTYPFGLEHRGYNNVVNGTENNYKTYQGQEVSKELGYNMHEFKWRHYDSALGRFVAIDPLARDFPQWSPYVFSGNLVIVSQELEGLEPKFMIGQDGNLSSPMVSLMSSAFGYSWKSLTNTNWVPHTDERAKWFSKTAVPDRASAITLGNQVVYNSAFQGSAFSNSARGKEYWFSLIGHEQQHRSDISEFGNALFYGTYGLAGASALGIHDNIAHEITANKSDGYAEQLWNYNGGEVQDILQNGDLSNSQKSSKLEVIGAKFRRDVILSDAISNDTKSLNSAKKSLKDAKGTIASPYVSQFLNDVIKAKQESINKAKKEQDDITKKYGN